MAIHTKKPASPGVSLAAWLEKWLFIYAPLKCRSLKTIERYRDLAGYVVGGRTAELAAVAGTHLSELTHTELEPALLSLLRVKGLRHEKLSTHTVRHIGSVLRTALDKAWRLDLVLTNPMLKVEMPTSDAKEARGLTRAEMWSLRDSAQGDWLCEFIEVALATGCRRGELLALEWADMNWVARTISVSKSLEQTRAGLRLKSTKGGKSRLLNLPRIAIEALRKQECGGHARLIFADDHGGHLKPDLVSQLIVRRIRKAGIGNASLHSLRHTHATHLISRGVPLPAIAARLGHADATVTARIYCHALALDDHRAADEWDKMFV